LAEKSLLSIVRIHNGGTSMVDIEICSGSKKKFTSIKEALRLPLWRNYDIPIGWFVRPPRELQKCINSESACVPVLLTVTFVSLQATYHVVMLELAPQVVGRILSVSCQSR
jgi:hypothetical protein